MSTKLINLYCLPVRKELQQLMNEQTNESSTMVENDITPLFSTCTEDDSGEWFRDKVRAVFEHFDGDQDQHLKFAELAALQNATSGTMLTEDMYVMACRALDCTPNNGISLDALKLTYGAEGSDIGECEKPVNWSSIQSSNGVKSDLMTQTMASS